MKFSVNLMIKKLNKLPTLREFRFVGGGGAGGTAGGSVTPPSGHCHSIKLHPTTRLLATVLHLVVGGAAALLVPDIASVFGSAEEARALSQALPLLPLLPLLSLLPLLPLLPLALPATTAFGKEGTRSELGGGGGGGGAASAVVEAR